MYMKLKNHTQMTEMIKSVFWDDNQSLNHFTLSLRKESTRVDDTQDFVALSQIPLLCILIKHYKRQINNVMLTGEIKSGIKCRGVNNCETMAKGHKKCVFFFFFIQVNVFLDQWRQHRNHMNRACTRLKGSQNIILKLASNINALIQCSAEGMVF